MEKHFKIGIFDDVSKAQHAVDDAISAGISREAIMLAVAENSPNASSGPINANFNAQVIHPASDTERGHFGGAFGAAVGALVGAIALYFAGTRSYAMPFGLVISGFAGMGVGALISRILPNLIHTLTHSSPRRLLGPIGHTYDTRRSMTAGAIGGTIGALAGTTASYLMGIPNLWFFVGAGFYCGVVSLIVGGLVGAMSGRGLSPQAMGQWEDLADSGNNVVVSIDCSRFADQMSQIEELLRRDGATLIRNA